MAKAVSWTDAWEEDGVAGGLMTLAMSSWTDVLFALGCGALGDCVVWLVRRHQRIAVILRRIFIALLTVFAIYGIIGVGVFHYFMRPLTFELLTMVGNAATVRSSIAERITWPFTLALLVVPPLFACLAAYLPTRRRVIAAAAVVAAAWVPVGYTQIQKSWPYETGHNLWRNPHTELIRTTAVRLTRHKRPEFPKDFPPEYVDEFRTFGARNITSLDHFQAPPDVPRPRNTIVVVLESIGTKYLRLYGHAAEFMPNLTAESRHALVFDNFYAHASFTYASFRPINFSVFPGLPWHYALLDNARPIPGTLASAFRQRGARTAYLTSGDLDWGNQRWVLQRSGSGFDVLEGANNLGCAVLSSWGTTDSCLFDRLLRWIDEDRERPFFAVAWTDQTHDPYLLAPGQTAVDPFQGKPTPRFANDLTRYLNLMREVDAQLGRLFAKLRERGIADDTMVVITGDHGEAFADPHDQRGHAFSVYDEEVRVPLLIWNPRMFNGERIATLGGHVDLNPTLADILDLPPDREWQGHSMFDPARPGRVFLMAVAGGDIFGLRDENWKYFYDVTSARESLFDLRVDPNEQIDVAAREPAVCLQLRQRVAAWVTFQDAFLWGKEN